MKVVVGLGNPGDKFIGTRHNLGFDFLEEYRRKKDVGVWSLDNKFKAEIIKTNCSQSSNLQPLILVRPLTFMNNSGLAVKLLTTYYRLQPTDLIVTHDDLDLRLGKVKVRLGGGAGGHHGVESIIQDLGTDQFIRIRLGIGNEKAFAGEHKRISFEAERFVLESFSQKEHSQVKRMIKKTMQALNLILGKGVEAAQNQFN